MWKWLGKMLSVFSATRSCDDIRERLEDYIDSGSANHDDFIDKSELVLVSNVLGLRDLRASDIMIPRSEIIAVQNDVEFHVLVSLFVQYGFSQIPVYNDTLDDVIGVISMIKVLEYVDKRDEFSIEKVMQEALFVAPSMHVIDLLIEIKDSLNHMAIVVDEFGGIDGLLTLNDLVTEIVGEIKQKSSHEEEMICVGDRQYIVSAKMLLDDFEEKTCMLQGIYTPDEIDDIDTIGGLVSFWADKVPQKGDKFRRGDVSFEIIDADLRKVKSVLISKV